MKIRSIFNIFEKKKRSRFGFFKCKIMEGDNLGANQNLCLEDKISYSVIEYLIEGIRLIQNTRVCLLIF